jgi:hypothetical protein
MLCFCSPAAAAYSRSLFQGSRVLIGVEFYVGKGEEEKTVAVAAE